MQRLCDHLNELWAEITKDFIVIRHRLSKEQERKLSSANRRMVQIERAVFLLQHSLTFQNSWWKTVLFTYQDIFHVLRRVAPIFYKRMGAKFRPWIQLIRRLEKTQRIFNRLMKKHMHEE